MIQIGSCDCSKTEIEMQAVPPTMTTMEDTQWTDYQKYPIPSLHWRVIMPPLNL